LIQSPSRRRNALKAAASSAYHQCGAHEFAARQLRTTVRASRYAATTLTPASGLIATANDLAKFDLALKRYAVMRPTTLALAWTAPLNRNGQPLPHGLGWFVQTYNGEPIVWQFGVADNASSSMIVTAPRRGVTLILLANSSGLARPFSLESSARSAWIIGHGREVVGCTLRALVCAAPFIETLCSRPSAPARSSMVANSSARQRCILRGFERFDHLVAEVIGIHVDRVEQVLACVASSVSAPRWRARRHAEAGCHRCHAARTTTAMIDAGLVHALHIDLDHFHHRPVRITQALVDPLRQRCCGPCWSRRRSRRSAVASTAARSE
jgi:hypothetical protein